MHILNMTHTGLGLLALFTFVLAYFFVIAEEFIHLRKSKPMLLAAGMIWSVVALMGIQSQVSAEVEQNIRHNLLEYAELLLFLIVAMTYVNTLQERQVFEALRAYLVKKQLGYRALFWITGILAFFISPIADNLTTALVMCSVVMAVGSHQPKFVVLSCINIVVAANAGGAFSPFGDITTLMVWQKGVLEFGDFFQLFVPAVVNFVIPAFCMQFAVPTGRPEALNQSVRLQPGAITVIILFLFTIALAVCYHNFLHLPPAVGMMFGLGLLKIYGYYLKRKSPLLSPDSPPFDIFKKIQNLEWDTLLFFYGVILCVGGLATIGYLQLASHELYTVWGQSFSATHQATPANITIGVLSAIIDNIPIMFAVLTMSPTMSEGQWLLVTLTAGVGGSLLSVGSAAGVGLMGQSKGMYTFFGHLKWLWAIALGYIASIACHIWLNHSLF
ncbi:MAG: sodium:proton antiporter NhaD [Gammaproteobacteria bacterium]